MTGESGSEQSRFVSPRVWTAAAIAILSVACASPTPAPPHSTSQPRTLLPPSAPPPPAIPPDRPLPGAIEELAMTLNHTLGRPFSFTFTPDGRTLLYLRSGKQDRATTLFALDLKTQQEKVVASAETLLGDTSIEETAAEKAARERKRIKVSGLTTYVLSKEGDKILLALSGQVFIHDLATGTSARVRLPEGELADPQLSPDGSRLAFVLDYDLYVARLGKVATKGIKTKITRLTRGGTATNPRGLAEFVAQEEMGRHHGYWWSPDSKRILYQSTDQTELDKFTIADASTPEKPAEVFPYPRAGRKNAAIRLHVVRVSGRGHAEVRWNRTAWAYVAKVDWSSEAPTVLLQARDQQSQVYLRIDVKNGATATLHEDRDPAWLNLHDTTPWWLDDGSYLWADESDRAWALYRYVPRPRRGARRTTVIGPEVGFHALIHVDEKTETVWFTGGPNPTELHLYRAPLDPTKGAPTRVSPDGGQHDAVFSRDGRRFVLTRAALDALPRSYVCKTSSAGMAADPLTTDQLSAEALEVPHTGSKPKHLPSVELVAPERAGGFHAAVVRPRKFTPGTSYPVILYVYGGPGVQYVKALAQHYVVYQWMADHGFIVVSVDGRGTPRRGRDHERALRLAFGTIALDDQVTALEALAETYPELDLDRVGVFGWSFGGYLSALAALRRPDVFKVAVAGAPVVDWTYYDTHYTERYLGLPQEQAEAYRQANLLTYADQLKVPLLLIHGIADDNVYFAHTLLLSDALFRSGRGFELLPLVGLTHQVSDGKTREAMYQKVVNYMGSVLW